MSNPPDVGAATPSTTLVAPPAERGASSGASAGIVPLSGVALGIDVGGTGVKAALVDLSTAELVTSRVRERTPRPSTPAAVLETMSLVVAQVLADHKPVEDLTVGCGLPGAIKGGVMKTAANLDDGWVDFDATTEISARLGRPVQVINDADAAGMAELAYGEARGKEGTLILLTVGTGIGSALISNGRLVPNTEFGHLEMRRKAAETLVSGAARTRRGLGWKRWAREFNQYLAMVEFYFWPDLIILGGGVSKESKRYWPYLRTLAPMTEARFLNTSGIIGAAYAAGLAAYEQAAAAEAAAAEAAEASPSGARATGSESPRASRSKRRRGGARTSATSSGGARTSAGTAPGS